MQDKLLKILRIKIDAINRNIDNLNYLNAELEKNTEDLNYIQDKIDIFGNQQVLNFDSLPRDDFEKVLLMIDPSVSDIFEDKACNYQGIMYIIDGIRQGISLRLTPEQENAIQVFIQEMINKKTVLEDVISNLNESKEKLPETDMQILSSELKKYQTIVSKLEEKLYLTEIDDIISAFDFANVPLEEKIGLFEFILKYNADIYTSNQISSENNNSDDEFSVKDSLIPEFHYEPINIYDELLPSNDEKDTKETEKKKPTKSEPEVTFKVPEVAIEPENTGEDIILPTNSIEPEAPTQTMDFNAYSYPDLDNNKVEVSEVKNQDNYVSTVELENLIGQIDEKLKEIEKSQNENQEKDKKEKNQNQEVKLEPDKIVAMEPQKDSNLNSTLEKYAIDKNALKDISNLNANNVEEVLSLLAEKDILIAIKENNLVLNNILKVDTKTLTKVLDEISLNLVSENSTFEFVIEIISATTPTLLTDLKVMNDFLQNILFYKDKNINMINLFDNYRELLIVDNEVLETNYSKIKNYGLSLDNDNVKYLLYNTNILEDLDYYLEAFGREKGFLGHEEEFDGLEYITKFPYKLNNINNSVLMRLRYATENNQKIFGSKPGVLSGEIANSKVDSLNLPNDYKKQFFNFEYGFLDRSELEKLLAEIKETEEFDVSENETIQKLDSKYKISDLKYKIDNLYFSRIKTIRLYNFLIKKNLKPNDALLLALTYNSVIKRDEYVKLESMINTLLEGGN